MLIAYSRGPEIEPKYYMKIQVGLCGPGIPLLREVGDRRVHGARWPAKLPELASER